MTQNLLISFISFTTRGVGGRRRGAKAAGHPGMAPGAHLFLFFFFTFCLCVFLFFSLFFSLILFFSFSFPFVCSISFLFLFLFFFFSFSLSLLSLLSFIFCFLCFLFPWKLIRRWIGPINIIEIVFIEFSVSFCFCFFFSFSFVSYVCLFLYLSLCLFFCTNKNCELLGINLWSSSNNIRSINKNIYVVHTTSKILLLE